MRILIVDDMDERHDAFAAALASLEGAEVVHARTYAESIQCLDGPGFDLIFLDHDLGNECVVQGEFAGKPLTGLDIATHITLYLRKPQWPSSVIVHSMNPIGAEAIVTHLRGFGIQAQRWAFNPAMRGLQLV